MDASRFDRLATSLATTETRRALLPLLSALPVAGLLTTLLGETGEAAKRRQRNRPQVGAVKKKKKSCAQAGQTTSKKRKTCCAG